MRYSRLVRRLAWPAISRADYIGRKRPSNLPNDSKLFRIAKEVRQALLQLKPIVALETAIYTHGFPNPENVELARELDATIRANGAIPATIGVLNGVATVGMTPLEVEELCAMPRKNLTKFSRRDLSFLVSKQHAYSDSLRLSGGTTVAGTMVLAHKAGIKFFATGGIGGVHRGAEHSFDVSADLVELGRTPVVVVCSGCKSFLDIPKTLEYLETQGVPVSSVTIDKANIDDFPAFWSVSSGFKAPMTAKSQYGASRFVHNHFELGLQTGLLLANPIPAQAEIAKPEMDMFIAEAIRLATDAGITGKDNTPFILDKIKELSAGRSVIANRTLVINNARVAARIADATAKAFRSSLDPLDKSTSIMPQHASVIAAKTISQVSRGKAEQVSIVVAGAVALDHSCDYSPLETSAANSCMTMHASNPASITQSLGGVGYNIARAAHLCGGDVQLFCKVGDDTAGRQTQTMLQQAGVLPTAANTVLVDERRRTAQYVAINDLNKNLVVGAADMAILEHVSEAEKIAWKQHFLKLSPDVLVVDGNWSVEMLRYWLELAQPKRRVSSRKLQLYFESVSAAKAVRLISALQYDKFPLCPHHLVDSITANELELTAMWSAAENAGLFDSDKWRSVIDAMNLPFGSNDRLIRATSAELVNQGIPQKCLQLLPLCHGISVSLGSKGVVVAKLILGSRSNKLTQSVFEPYIIARASNSQRPASEIQGVYIRHFTSQEILEPQEIASVNGAGDTFLGALVVARLKSYHDTLSTSSIHFAQKAACLTLQSKESVSPAVGDLVNQLRGTTKARYPSFNASLTNRRPQIVVSEDHDSADDP